MLAITEPLDDHVLSANAAPMKIVHEM